MPVTMIEGLDKVLIEQMTLETLNLVVDPGTGRLVRKRRGHCCISTKKIGVSALPLFFLLLLSLLLLL
ncbi:hypothetical protein [Vulcanisaeta sp. JCM 16159]|uniref:hypothetical protein n=1 Tax=Vulcanisaeta sp. JCM 16159 TaxID=1295371 RepID=UPI001FB3F888|nr:hypothetical protein [Vulcanisaeta sp. JCM 16159]